MAKTPETKYFIPSWILEDRSLSSGDKLVLCILSTRSTQIDDAGNRASYRIGAGAISDLLGYSHLQVTKILKKLEGSLIKKIDGGFLLLSPDAPAPQEVPVQDAPTETPPVEQALTLNEPLDYVPVDLFKGCFTWEECVGAIMGKRVCVADLLHSYEVMSDSASYKSNLYKYLLQCKRAQEAKGSSDTDTFQVEKKS
jgi:hypothetical protein